ncbi:hypothetical protein [Wenjunlia tyrosinilytica]|uniref:Uncharacterized protein n=1 Tax=Wenjunlia tyrosinilytica TaxID=1544741 RepID=A0A918DSR9_9ACTN|nr:hypothetical protein [Wenjunlia tyrosinilytica]GGO81358.1 hypothetical protein GCM10012280_05390 [Wenjunlia tyrosinilytica]
MADGPGHDDDVTAMPPVRLLPQDVLARLAMESPLFDTAVRLARWIAPRRPVTEDGVLELGDARRAVRELELLPEAERESVLGKLSGAEELEELDLPWSIAEELGLIDIDDDTAEPGGALTAVDRGSTEDLLELWWDAAEVVVADACLPGPEALMAAAEGDEDEEFELGAEAELLYAALENLYLIAALEPEPDGGGPDGGGPDGGGHVGGGCVGGSHDGRHHEGGGQAVPLPVLAASMVVPDDMDSPTDEALEEVSSLMMELDAVLQLVIGTGVVDYQPVDPALVAEDEDGTLPGESGESGEYGEEPDDADVTRYGMVRLTPLGIYGVRRRLLATGVVAPALGELAGARPGELLDAMAFYPDSSARLEAQGWLEGREPLEAARELLAACRGDEPHAPLRRLYCQQVLALLGPKGDPALREVLDDRHLGGLARVRLVEHGAADVPEPSEEMVFWLTVDTLAAQLADDDEELLAELVRGIPVREQPDSFFTAAWQVDHPATAEVLEALGRLHPDRAVAKEARKAAFKARSRSGAQEE